MKYIFEKLRFISFIFLILLVPSGILDGNDMNFKNRRNRIIEEIKNSCIVIDDFDNLRACFKNGNYLDSIPTSYVNGQLEKCLGDGKFLDSVIFTLFSSDSLEYAIVPISCRPCGKYEYCIIVLFRCESNSIKQLGCNVVDYYRPYHSVVLKGKKIIVRFGKNNNLKLYKFIFKKDKLVYVK